MIVMGLFLAAVMVWHMDRWPAGVVITGLLIAGMMLA